MTSQPSSGPQSWSPRRWWSLVAGLGLLIFGYAVYEFFRDDSPPDDDDLMVEFTPGPDAENGALILAEIAGQLEDKENGPFLDEIMEPEDGSPPDWEAVRAFLAERADAMGQLDAVLAAAHFHGPWPPKITTELPSLDPGLRLARLLDALARLQLRDGEPNAAWLTLMKCLRLGERLENSHQGLLGMLMGLAIKTDTLKTIRDHQETFAPCREIARQRIRKLAPFSLSNEERGNVMKQEYMATLSIPDLIAASQSVDVDGSSSGIPTLFYRPNRTQGLFAEYYREVVRNSELPAKKRDWNQTQMLTKTSVDLPWRSLPNVAGLMLFGILVSPLEALFLSLDESNCFLELTRLGLALAGYANEHGGALPPTLEALAPDYIDAVPLDPITGEPFHYDPAARKVWSVGPDLTDDGGFSRKDGQLYRDPYDLVIEIPAAKETAP